MNFVRLISSGLFILLTLNNAFSQNKFHLLIGGYDNDRAQTVFNTFDGNYMINGASFSFGVGNVDAILIKTDDTGQPIWSIAYGQSDYDNSEYAIEASDHGIVCVGRSILQGGATSAIIFKTDSAGNFLWGKSFGGIDNDGLVNVIETYDNGYAAIGNTKSVSSGNADILFIRTNNVGDTIFARSYGSVEVENGLSIIQLPDSGFAICGRQITFPGGHQVSDGLLLRTDAFGNLLWVKMYGDSLLEELTSLKYLPDSGFILTGSASAFGQVGYDILLMKTNNSGDVLWSEAFGGDYADAAYDIHLDGNNFVLSGYTESLGYGHSRGEDSANVFLMKTDENGSLIWMQTYGDGLQDEAFRSAIADDGGYIIPGFTTNYLFNDSSQMLFIKTDSLGSAGCHEENVVPLDTMFTMSYQPVTFSQLSGIATNTLSFTSTPFTPDVDDACLFSSINNPVEELDLLVYPNPFNESLEILVRNNAGEEEVIISDIFGRIVKNFKVNSSQTRIQTTDLKQGIYFVSIVGKPETSIVVK